MPSVKVPPFVVSELAARFESAGAVAGFRPVRFGEVAGCPLLALTRRTPGPRPRIYLSAGIHGDEPAAPLALLQMLESGVFDDRAVWFLCPLLNPAGLARGQRENADGIDLNRDYRNPQANETLSHIAWLRRQPNFDLTLCLHEDWEAVGFYLYELNPGGRPSLAEAMIEAVGRTFPIDRSELIDDRPARGGILRPDIDPQEREKWPESIYLRANHHSGIHYTVEAPSGFPLDERIAALRTAAETAIARVRAYGDEVRPPAGFPKP